MTTVVDIRSHVTTRQWMEICLQHGENCCNLERCFVADNGIYCNGIYCSEMLVGGVTRV